jgi:hypothetical protein
MILVLGACSEDSPTMDANPSMPGAAVPSAAADGGAPGDGGARAAVDAGSSALGGAGAAQDSGGGSLGPDTGGGAGGTSGSGSDAGVPASDAAGAPGADAARGDGGAAGCTRELLQATVDQYFKALAAHNPMMLPLADNAKFTEDGQVLQLGSGGLWQSAGMVKYEHSALDVDTCSSVSEAVVPDGTRDIPFGLRLKLQGQKISEIETIAVQPGDYKVFGSDFPSNPGAISRSAMTVKWTESVPEAQRSTRAEIEKWLNKYFRSFPGGGCNLAPNCQRLENGGGNFTCDAALSCSTAEPSATGEALRPRLFVIDVERGIGVCFVMFMGHTDFHMIKMHGGQIYAVHAILAAAMNPGWP